MLWEQDAVGSSPATSTNTHRNNMKRKGDIMFRANVVKKWFEVTLANDIGETSTFRIDAETETAARLMCEREGWRIISLIEA